MDYRMTTHCYPISEYDTFARQHVLRGNRLIPTDHYHTGIVVKAGGNCLAAAVLYVNPHMAIPGRRPGIIGVYGATENTAAVSRLFETAEALAGEAGLDFLIGPMDGSTWEDYRFHDHPERPLFLMEMQHPSYYPNQWKSAGFQPVAHYFSTTAPLFERPDTRMEQVKSRLLHDGITFRGIDHANYGAELRKLHPFLLEAFKQNRFYTPIGLSSFVAKYRPMKDLMKSGFIQIAEYGGEIAGVLFCVANPLDPTGGSLVVKTLARRPGRMFRGLGQVMVEALYQKALAAGYRQLIFAFMIADGDARPLSDRYNGRTLKTYTLYGKAI